MEIDDYLGLDERKLWIDGAPCDAAGGVVFDVVDPAREAVIARVPRGQGGDVDAAVAAARAALPDWSRLAPAARAACLRELAESVSRAGDTLAAIEVLDAGKPWPLARQEVASCVDYLQYYAGAVDKIQGETIPLGDGYLDYTQHEPLGVTAHIVPWNAPLGMICRSLAPALAAGNTAVIKPAEQTPLGALKLAHVFAETGLAAGVVNVITGYGTEAGAALASHPGIDSITFTGSVKTGRTVLAAAAEHIKPVVVELGAKSPQIVLPDVDPDWAAQEIAKGIFTNSGQYCDAGARLLVHESIAEAVVEQVATIASRLAVGPGCESPDLGPLVSQEHFERVCGYLTLAREEGASPVIGGEPLSRTGYFVPPTIFKGVQPHMRVYREEIFGPVLTVTEFSDDAEALALANDSDYGLAAGIFTRDIDRALWFSSRVEAGYVMVNEYFAGGVNAPFGGCKLTGYSRERGLQGLKNYTQVKNVAMRWSAPGT